MHADLKRKKFLQEKQAGENWRKITPDTQVTQHLHHIQEKTEGKQANTCCRILTLRVKTYGKLKTHCCNRLMISF